MTIIKLSLEKSQRQKIVYEFENIWNFPTCIGSIDGKHIVMECPSNSMSDYFNYKSTFSIVLLALVDHEYNYLVLTLEGMEAIVMQEYLQKHLLKKR